MTARKADLELYLERHAKALARRELTLFGEAVFFGHDLVSLEFQNGKRFHYKKQAVWRHQNAKAL